MQQAQQNVAARVIHNKNGAPRKAPRCLTWDVEDQAAFA